MVQPINGTSSNSKLSQRVFKVEGTYSGKTADIMYTDGQRTEVIKIASDSTINNPNSNKIFYALYTLSQYSTEDSPNMTKDEFNYALNYDIVPGVYSDCEIKPEARDLFIKATKPYIAETSDGGSDITVTEMMNIANEMYIDALHDEERSQKPWYKFW